MQDGKETQQNERDKELAGEGQVVTSNRVDGECPTEKGTWEQRLQGGDSQLEEEHSWQREQQAPSPEGWSREKSDGDAAGEDTEGAESGMGLGPGTCTT